MSKLKHYLLLFAVSMLLAGCGDDELQALTPGDTILAFGDSLTFGKGTTTEYAYPAVLQELSGYPVVNAGVSGETTAEGLLRLPEMLDEHAPALVVLFEGGNDILRKLPGANTRSNLDKMIQMIREQGAQVVLVGVPDKLLASSAPWYNELAEQHDVPIQSTIVSKLLKKPSMKSDRVHFNQAGYREIAKAIFSLLDKNGAL